MKRILKTVPLVVLTILSTACQSDLQYQPPCYCPAAVKTPKSVKEWLHNQATKPEDVKYWLKSVSDQQQAILDNCY